MLGAGMSSGHDRWGRYVSTDAYLDARIAFECTEQEIKALATNIVNVGMALRDAPGRFSFSNAPAELPAEAIMGRGSKSFDANSWPSAAAVNAKLKEWHARHAKMIDAWSAVPHERRGSLLAPTEGKSGRDPYR